MIFRELRLPKTLVLMTLIMISTPLISCLMTLLKEKVIFHSEQTLKSSSRKMKKEGFYPSRIYNKKVSES
jgi:hypothetical protein